MDITPTDTNSGSHSKVSGSEDVDANKDTQGEIPLENANNIENEFNAEATIEQGVGSESVPTATPETPEQKRNRELAEQREQLRKGAEDNDGLRIMASWIEVHNVPNNKKGCTETLAMLRKLYPLQEDIEKLILEQAGNSKWLSVTYVEGTPASNVLTVYLPLAEESAFAPSTNNALPLLLTISYTDQSTKKLHMIRIGPTHSRLRYQGWLFTATGLTTGPLATDQLGHLYRYVRSKLSADIWKLILLVYRVHRETIDGHKRYLAEVKAMFCGDLNMLDELLRILVGTDKSGGTMIQSEPYTVRLFRRPPPLRCRSEIAPRHHWVSSMGYKERQVSRIVEIVEQAGEEEKGQLNSAVALTGNEQQQDTAVKVMYAGFTSRIIHADHGAIQYEFSKGAGVVVATQKPLTNAVKMRVSSILFHQLRTNMRLVNFYTRQPGAISPEQNNQQQQTTPNRADRPSPGTGTPNAPPTGRGHEKGAPNGAEGRNAVQQRTLDNQTQVNTIPGSSSSKDGMWTVQDGKGGAMTAYQGVGRQESTPGRGGKGGKGANRGRGRYSSGGRAVEKESCKMSVEEAQEEERKNLDVWNSDAPTGSGQALIPRKGGSHEGQSRELAIRVKDDRTQELELQVQSQHNEIREMRAQMMDIAEQTQRNTAANERSEMVCKSIEDRLTNTDNKQDRMFEMIQDMWEQKKGRQEGGGDS
jgi:hypothetical protein